jgi:hypothetical protein
MEKTLLTVSLKRNIAQPSRACSATLPSTAEWTPKYQQAALLVELLKEIGFIVTHDRSGV